LQSLRAFDESVSSSSIPQQTAGEGQEINKEQLPGPGAFASLFQSPIMSLTATKNSCSKNQVPRKVKFR
jgi:hypothetical protein